MFKRKDPPPRKIYLSMIVLTPCLILGGLWKQGDLTAQTASLALSVNALFYLNLKWIQDFFRPTWRQEYQDKLADANAQLTRDDLSPKERMRLQRYVDKLPDRYHLVTSPEVTYGKITAIGTLMSACAKAIKSMFR